MRYQERIYIQNSHNGLRNRDNSIANMSSDMCTFNTPIFNLSGASKLDCTGATSGTSYVINTETTIPLTFQFTGNTDSFSGTNASFKYELYKFNDSVGYFPGAPIFKSDVISYSAFSGTNTTLQNIPLSGLSLDGEYLVKGYYEFDACTYFLNKLGKKIDTLEYKSGLDYNLYQPELDYYFIAIKQAESPIFLNDGGNTVPVNSLRQQIILPENIGDIYDSNGNLVSYDGKTTFTFNGDYGGSFIVTLNGLTLSPDEDYTFTGNIITLNTLLVSDDIITVIFTSKNTTSGGNIFSETIKVDSIIPSGATNNEGSNNYYFNTTTDKYELFITTIPNGIDNVIVMINGATLANNVDYYQSSSNPKRIILNGDLLDDDIILIVYYPKAGLVNGITTNTPLVVWEIDTPPQKENGVFTLQVSNDTSFNTIYYSATTDYIIDNTLYSTGFNVSGSSGTKLYYRVKNEKNYVTLCGDIVNSTAYSDIIPVVIQSNSINNY
jgi:hypothetical protein